MNMKENAFVYACIVQKMIWLKACGEAKHK
jgi:hypothetical protein